MSDYCRYQVVHPGDEFRARHGGLTVYDPAGIIPNIRWIDCGDFVEYLGPGRPVSEFCPYHNRLIEELEYKIAESKVRQEVITQELLAITQELPAKAKKEKPVFNVDLNPDGPFKVHKLNERGKLRAQVIAGAFNQLLSLVQNNARPEPPYKATISDPCAEGYPAVNTKELEQFILKLQEASFYAKRAIAVLPENQQ